MSRIKLLYLRTPQQKCGYITNFMVIVGFSFLASGSELMLVFLVLAYLNTFGLLTAQASDLHLELAKNDKNLTFFLLLHEITTLHHVLTQSDQWDPNCSIALFCQCILTEKLMANLLCVLFCSSHQWKTQK